MKVSRRILRITKMSITKLPIAMIAVFILLSNLVYPEVVEKIYAVVNDEIITYSELKDFERGMMTELKNNLKGEELAQKVEEMKAHLLDMMIDQKLLLSRAKEKDYDVTQYLEIVIKEIMKQNNFDTKDQLLRALTASGIEYEDWKNKRKDELLTQSLIQNEIGNKVKVENSELMAYYRENTDKYTIPAQVSLNCIFLKKENYFTKSALDEKKQEISAKLASPGAKFEEIANQYSELPGAEKKHFLGNFKKGELDAKLEAVAFNLKQDEISSWIDTDNGCYIIQLVKLTESRLVEFKTVRDKIERLIKNQKMQKKIGEYVDQLKKDSHIKIYNEYH